MCLNYLPQDKGSEGGWLNVKVPIHLESSTSVSSSSTLYSGFPLSMARSKILWWGWKVFQWTLQLLPFPLMPWLLVLREAQPPLKCLYSHGDWGLDMIGMYLCHILVVLLHIWFVPPSSTTFKRKVLHRSHFNLDFLSKICIIVVSTDFHYSFKIPTVSTLEDLLFLRESATKLTSPWAPSFSISHQIKGDYSGGE